MNQRINLMQKRSLNSLLFDQDLYYTAIVYRNFVNIFMHLIEAQIISYSHGMVINTHDLDSIYLDISDYANSSKKSLSGDPTSYDFLYRQDWCVELSHNCLSCLSILEDTSLQINASRKMIAQKLRVLITTIERSFHFHCHSHFSVSLLCLFQEPLIMLNDGDTDLVAIYALLLTYNEGYESDASSFSLQCTSSQIPYRTEPLFRLAEVGKKLSLKGDFDRILRSCINLNPSILGSPKQISEVILTRVDSIGVNAVGFFNHKGPYLNSVLPSKKNLYLSV